MNRVQGVLDLVERFGWGGKRKGAGRKRGPGRKRMKHRARPAIKDQPIHVTLRVSKRIPNLRKKRLFFAVRGAFAAARERFGMRLIAFSVLKDHIHLIVEA